MAQLVLDQRSVEGATIPFDKPTEQSEGGVMLGLICKKGQLKTRFQIC